MGLLRSLRKRGAKRRKPTSPIEMMATLLEPRHTKVVFDVGANEGDVTERLLQSLSPDQLFAFEPMPDTFARLETRFSSNPVVAPCQLAVGRTEGEVTFNINKTEAYNNSLLEAAKGAEKWHDIEHVSTATVECVTLDAFCAAHRIEEIDAIKIDVEGADFLVLEGAEEMLRRKRIKLIYVEVLFTPSFVGQASLGQFIYHLEGHGLSFFNLFGHKEDDKGRLFRADAMFVRNDLLE